MQQFDITVSAVAIFTNPTQIRLWPKCRRISFFGRVYKMQNGAYRYCMFRISTSFKNCAVVVAIFLIRLFTFLRSCHHSRLTRSRVMNIACRFYIHPSILSSFMNKSQVRTQLRPDLCHHVQPDLAPAGFTKLKSSTALVSWEWIL